MKTKTFIAIALLAVATVVDAVAQNNTITIKVTKASKALVEQWKSAYEAENPDVVISLVDKTDDAILSITTSPIDAVANGANITYVGRYAVLPVTSTENPLYDEVVAKKWNEKDIKRLFFQSEDDRIDEAGDKTKKERLSDKLTVFSGNNSTSIASSFAQHFGYEKGDIRGKRIQGDDIFLLNAIQKDKQSVTFNNVAYLYDTESRQLKQHIAILPLNLKKEQEQTLLSGNLDETLALLENSSISTIPVEIIGFAYKTYNDEVDNFLAWVVSEGQQYNNKAGYLKLDLKDQKKQLAHLDRK